MWAELPYTDLQFPYGIPLQGSVTLSYPQLLEYETSYAFEISSLCPMCQALHHPPTPALGPLIPLSFLSLL